MNSIEELKIVRLYRAYNNVIQMCIDRGYTVRHPSAVAQVICDPRVFSNEEGLDYNWFLDHFVVQQAASASPVAESTEKKESNNAANNNNNSHVGNSADNINRALNARGSGGSEFLSQENKRLLPTRGAMRLVCYTAAEFATDDKRDARSGAGDKGRPLLVYFLASPSLTLADVRECREKALQKHAKCMIVVSANKIPPAVRRGTRELSGRLVPGTTEEVMSIQLFEEDELSCNIARHETVPPHVVLSPAETQAFLQQRRIALSQLPRLLYEDPMVAYLGIARGSVVKIERDSKESGPYEMYRQVV